MLTEEISSDDEAVRPEPFCQSRTSHSCLSHPPACPCSTPTCPCPPAGPPRPPLTLSPSAAHLGTVSSVAIPHADIPPAAVTSVAIPFRDPLVHGRPAHGRLGRPVPSASTVPSVAIQHENVLPASVTSVFVPSATVPSVDVLHMAVLAIPSRPCPSRLQLSRPRPTRTRTSHPRPPCPRTSRSRPSRPRPTRTWSSWSPRHQRGHGRWTTPA